MADEKDVAITEEDVDLEFEAGYGNTPTASVPPGDAETELDTPPDTPTEGAPPAAEVVPEEVAYHQLTAAQWKELQDLSTQVTSIRADSTKRLDQAFGKVGGLERTLQQLQQATPAGLSVEVTDDIVADLAHEFPEVGSRTLAAFKAFAGKIKGTGPAIQPTTSAADIEANVQKEVQSRIIALQLEALEDERPNWRDLTGAVDSNTPYRQWLAAQPAEYQQKLVSTNSAQVISRSITKFEADAAKAEQDRLAAEKKTSAKPAAPSTRQQQLAAAAVTRGAGGRSPGATDDDEFNAGFQSG